MKIISVLAVLVLASSCRESPEMRAKTRRCKEVAKMLGRGDYVVEGPFTVATIEAKIIELHEASQKGSPSPVRFEDAPAGETWAQVQSQYREGDEFYYYYNKPAWFHEKGGVTGYVLVRGNEIIRYFARMYFTYAPKFP